MFEEKAPLTQVKIEKKEKMMDALMFDVPTLAGGSTRQNILNY